MQRSLKPAKVFVVVFSSLFRPKPRLRKATNFDRPICENDVGMSAKLWRKSAHLWEWIKKSALLSELAQLWKSAYLREPAQL